METKLGDWYACEIDRGELNALVRRSDAKGLAQFGGTSSTTARRSARAG